MHRTSTNLSAKFDAIEANCKPQSFLRLAVTARNFISVASLLSDIREESEFQRTFNRLIGLMVRFYGAFEDAYEMGLLVSVDESTKSAPRELRDLDRALANQERRTGCLGAVCRLAEAVACLVGIRRFPNYASPWVHTFALLLQVPILATLFQDIDLAKWAPLRGEAEKRFAALAESAGFRRIEIQHCCEDLIVEAGELWMDSLTHGLEEGKLEECARRMRRVLNFLTMPAQERWILQELRAIGSTDSMQAVFKEIVRYDLRRVADSDNLDRSKLGQYFEPESGFPPNVLVLTQGWLWKQKYLVIVPELSYFTDRPSSITLEEATTDPVKFLRKHWRDAPRSMRVEHCQQQLLRIESATLDVKFRQTMEHVMANLAGETFALAVSTSVGTSPEVSIFIAGCFGIAVDVMMSLRKR
jgi:hypothetical protein